MLSAPEQGRAVFVLEDDAIMRRAYRRYLCRYGTLCTVSSVPAARELMLRHACQAIIADEQLESSNGTLPHSGLDFIEELRSTTPGLPALLVTGRDDAETTNRAFQMGVSFLRKPAPMEWVARWLVSNSLATIPLADALRTHVLHAASCRRLTPAQTRVLLAAACGTSRNHLAVELGLSDNTVKSHARMILQKFGEVDGIEELSRRLLRECLDRRCDEPEAAPAALRTEGRGESGTGATRRDPTTSRGRK